jgi:hypothetical protein
MRVSLALFILLFSVSGGCTSLNKAGDAQANACPAFEGGGYLFNIEKRSVETGSQFELRPYFMARPGSFEPLPTACLNNIKISDPNFGSVEKTDNDQILIQVSDSAETGSLVYITAHYLTQSIMGRYTAYDSAASPLIGRWSQDKTTCAPGSHIEELIFSADETFSVTWQPFESYKDYWGQYEYEAETGQLTLKVEAGNNIPPDVMSGKIRLSDDAFEALTASFGTADGKYSCSNPFSKTRG